MEMPPLKNQSGMYDASLMAPALGLSIEEFASAVNATPAWLVDHPADTAIQPQADKVARALACSNQCFKDWNNTLDWLKKANPELEGCLPLRLILDGQAEDVEGMAWAILTGQPI